MDGPTTKAGNAMVRQGTELEFDNRTRADEVVVVTPRGVLDVRSVPRLRHHLVKVGADHPRAIVVDLADLDVRSPVVATAFATAHAELAAWPGVPLALVCTDRTHDLLAHQHLHRFLHLRRSVAEAVAAIGEPSPRRVERLLLPNSPASPDLARRFARASCVLWEHPAHADVAASLLGELVSNTVAHTTSVARIRVELRRGLLSVAVGDDDPTVPQLWHHGDDDDDAGTSGLALVARTASAWGCLPTLLGGKVVWAALRVDGPRQPAREAEERSVSRGERP